MTDSNHPKSLSDSLLDLLRGELPPGERAALEARIAADPALAAEAKRVEALLAAAKGAHDLALDDEAGARMAARIRHRVQREEARTFPEVAAPPVRSLRWARYLAVAVAAEVLLVGGLFLVLRERHGPADGEDRPLVIGTEPEGFGPSVADVPSGLEPTITDGILPIEDLLAREATASMSDETIGLPSSNAAAKVALPGFTRAAAARTSDVTKEAIFARVGRRDDLKQVQASLRALAVRQESDGSFPAGSEASRVRVTATALLAFLGDGHTSRRGDHKQVVEKGVRWLRAHASDATGEEEKALLLAALTEDYAFSSGDMPASEAKERGREIASLANAMPASGAPWVAMALDGVGRARLGPAADGRGWSRAYAAIAVPSLDPRTAVVEGTALLLQLKGDSFREWNQRVGRDFRARLGNDGLARAAKPSADLDAQVGDRVEETSWIVLALQVPYRTY